MDQVREVLSYHHYAYRTEQTYCQWILHYIHYFGGKTHPRLLGGNDRTTILPKNIHDEILKQVANELPLCAGERRGPPFTDQQGVVRFHDDQV